MRMNKKDIKKQSTTGNKVSPNKNSNSKSKPKAKNGSTANTKAKPIAKVNNGPTVKAKVNPKDKAKANTVAKPKTKTGPITKPNISDMIKEKKEAFEKNFLNNKDLKSNISNIVKEKKEFIGKKFFNDTNVKPGKNNILQEKEKTSIKINRGDIYSNTNLNTGININQNNTRPYPNITTQPVNNNNSEISHTEALNKMVSLCKSFFINGTVFIAVATILIGAGVFFSGYDPIPLIEKHFIYTSKEEAKAEEAIVKLHSIDLSKQLQSEDTFSTLYDFVNVKLGEIILDKELYDSGLESFNQRLSQYSTIEYSGEMISNSVVYQMLNSIYSSTNRYPYSVTLTSIGSVTRNSSVLTKLSVDVNAVDDDLGFHVWNLAIFLNSDNKIHDVKLLAENKTLTNTRTPLDPALSVLTNGVNDNLSRTVNSFLKGITNESLYNKLNASAKPFNESQLKAFFSKLSLKDADYGVLSEMFKVSRGNGSNFAITEVISTDFDGEPITDVILSIKIGEEVYKYDLQYNRREKALVSISKV